MKVKGKFHGSHRAVEIFKAHLEREFVALTSNIKDSSQGDYHCFFTVEVGE